MENSAKACYLPKDFINPPSQTIGSKFISSNMGCLIGVDGGGTKTLAVAYNLKDDKMGIGLAGPSNPESVGTAAAVDAVRSASLVSLTAVGAASDNVACAVLSIAGITGDQDSRMFEKNFTEFSSVHATNDVVAAWASGTMCKQGIAIIAGTGSHTIGVNDKGAYCRAGGWGHITGDEGAGYMIGLSGIREALKCYDGRAEKTTLLDRMLDFYKIQSADEMLRVVYKENLSKDRISAFAEAMADEAMKGDKAAARIFEEAGKELGTAACAVARRLEICDKTFPVALIGSVFISKQLILPSLESMLKQCAPGANVVFPSIPPVAGALLLAVRSAGLWQSIDLSKFEQKVNLLLHK
jgi:glucosamine kinase